MRFALLALVLPLAAQDVMVIRDVTVHPMTGPDIALATVLVRDGVIADIAPKLAVPKGTRIVEGKGLHLYPGMIDSGTDIGLNEIDSIRETQDRSEIGDFNPQLRTLIAINPASEHIPVARANGITSVVSMPRGGMLPGQSSLVHLDGWTWEEMAIKNSVAQNIVFPVYGTAGRGGEGGGGGRGGGGRGGFAETKRRHDEQVNQLRDYFEQARRYQKAKDAGGAGFKVDRKFEAMIPMIERQVPVVIEAARERAIKEVLEFTAKENLRLVLSGIRDPGSTLAEIKKRNVPVILGKTLSLPIEEDAPYDSQFALPGQLFKEGILIAFGTFDDSFVRNLPYEAAASVGFGLPANEALKAVTVNAAKIWGVDDKLGSIEKGKWADLILTDGDPLEARTQIKQMWIRGKAVSLDNRHLKLYEKYLARP